MSLVVERGCNCSVWLRAVGAGVGLVILCDSEFPMVGVTLDADSASNSWMQPFEVMLVVFLESG